MDDKKTTFVPTVLYTTATPELDEEVAEELSQTQIVAAAEQQKLIDVNTIDVEKTN